MMDKIQVWLAQHFKSAEDVVTACVVAMFISLGLGKVLNVERLVWLGIAFFGAAVVTWGVDALQTRELRIFQHGIRVAERASELFARLWGIVFIGGGVLIFGYGILATLNPRVPVPARVQRFFGAPPGPQVLLLVGSAIGMLYGLTMLFADEARGSNSFVRLVMSLPGRLLGFVLVIIFAALAFIALLQISAPDILVTLEHAIFQRMGLE